MAIETISFKWAWKLITWLPGFLQKWFFPKVWFEKQVKVDLRPRYEAVTLFAGDKKDIKIWLRVTNFTYFDIEVEKLIIKYMSAGHTVELTNFKKQVITSLSYWDFLLDNNLTSDHVAAIERTYSKHQRENIFVYAEINSKVQNFKLDLSLDNVQSTLNNFNLVDI